MTIFTPAIKTIYIPKQKPEQFPKIVPIEKPIKEPARVNV